MNVEFLIQLTINGFLLGMFYATMTLGFSIIWGVMRLINLAHGEFLIMGSYVAFFLFNPQRVQVLSIGSQTPDEVQSAIETVFIGLAVIIGFIVSELIRNRPQKGMGWLSRLMVFIGTGMVIQNRFQFRTRWQSRLVGFPIGMFISYRIYLYWQSAGFKQVIIPVKDMMFVGLWLSLGFVLSHFILRNLFADKIAETEQLPWSIWHHEVWLRRLISYTLAYIVVRVYIIPVGDMNPMDPYKALPLVALLFFALGYILQRGLFNQLVEGPYLTMLLVTFAIKIMLQNIGLRIYAGDPRQVDPDYANAFWSRGDLTADTFKLPVFNTKIPNPLGIIPEESFPDITLPQDKTYVVLVSLLMVVGLIWFLRYTRMGQAIRAAAQNKFAARLVGINIKETYAITFGIALASTAIAGVMMSTFQPITPISGSRWTLRAFAIVALGGLGRIQGVLLGGIILGLTESYIGGYLPQVNEKIPQFEITNATGWAIAASFILLVIMLIVRPQGITGGLVLEDD